MRQRGHSRVSASAEGRAGGQARQAKLRLKIKAGCLLRWRVGRYS
jgi:hypothetical protein